MTGEGYSHLLRKRHWAIYTVCRAYLAAASLAAHIEMKQGWLVRAAAANTTLLIPEPPAEYRVASPRTHSLIDCLVKGYIDRYKNHTNIWIYLCTDTWRKKLSY